MTFPSPDKVANRIHEEATLSDRPDASDPTNGAAIRSTYLAICRLFQVPLHSCNCQRLYRTPMWPTSLKARIMCLSLKNVGWYIPSYTRSNSWFPPREDLQHASVAPNSPLKRPGCCLFGLMKRSTTWCTWNMHILHNWSHSALMRHHNYVDCKIVMQ